MSITRKGRNSRKPISKARRSSLIMKAGIRLRIGVSSGEAGVSASERSRKSCRSSGRTWPSMNSRSGPVASSKASRVSICSASSGARAWS